MQLSCRESRQIVVCVCVCVYVAEAVGEVDPVYTFLKLTSGMPREGASVIPDDDHYCCSRTDEDIGVGTDDHAGPSIVAPC